jgi:hypothetical protein
MESHVPADEIIDRAGVQLETDENGEEVRVYGELMTGKLAVAIEDAVAPTMPEDCLLAYLIFHSDKTTTRRMGSHSFYPVYVTLANFPLKYRER